MDETGLAILGASFGGARLVEKLLGPTAEYIGGGIKNWTKRRVQNVNNIFAKAHKKLGDRINEPGSVPPRVLKEILDEGSFCDDSLMAEYFGGVLASSRSQMSRDDRGATWSALVARLSFYQIRTHFLIYRAIYDRFRGQGIRFNMEDRPHSSILLPIPQYIYSIEFSQEELGQLDSLLQHSFFGLQKNGLIESFMYGSPNSFQKMWGDDFQLPEKGGIWVEPSNWGIELFLWAHGHGNRPMSDFLHLELEVPDGIKLCADVLSKDDMKASKSK